MKGKSSELKAGVILSYIVIFVQNIISIAYTPIMLRILGKSQYGLYNLVFSVVSYLGLLSFGFGSAYMRYYSKYKAQEDQNGMAKVNGMFMSIFSIMSIISLLAGSILILNIENIFHSKLSVTEIGQAKILMVLMVINIAITFPASVYDANVTANEKYVFQKILQVVKTVLNPFLALPLLLLGYKSISLVVVTTIITVGSLLVNIWYCKRSLKIKFKYSNFDFGMMKEMWVFSFYIFLNMIVDQINWNVDKFIVGMYSGTVAVAIYSLGAQINTYYLSFSTSISSVFIPKVHRMVSSANDDYELTRLFTKVGRIQFIVLSFILCTFAVIGKYFVWLWGGEGYSNSYYIALILILPVTIPLIQNIGIEIQRAKNLHKFRSVVYFFIALGNIGLSIPLAKLYGGIGAAIGTAIALIIGNVILMNIYYHIKVKLNMIYFWKEISKMSLGLIFPVVIGGLIYKLVVIDNIMQFMFIGVGYSVIFLMSMWIIGMNDYERGLILGPINRVMHRLTLRES